MAVLSSLHCGQVEIEIEIEIEIENPPPHRIANSHNCHKSPKMVKIRRILPLLPLQNQYWLLIELDYRKSCNILSFLYHKFYFWCSMWALLAMFCKTFLYKEKEFSGGHVFSQRILSEIKKSWKQEKGNFDILTKIRMLETSCNIVNYIIHICRSV